MTHTVPSHDRRYPSASVKPPGIRYLATTRVPSVADARKSAAREAMAAQYAATSGDLRVGNRQFVGGEAPYYLRASVSSS